MALFKPFRGTRAALDALEKHDGYAYFCTDDGSFHIDYVDADGNLQRKQVNEDYIRQNIEDVQGQIDDLVEKTNIQPDWNQNDPTAPDYIKNRTHYIDSSKNLEDITWDGNEAGYEVVDPWDGFKFVKVSDQAPLPEDVIGGKVYYDGNNVQDITPEDMNGGESDWNVAETGHYYICVNNCDSIYIVISPDKTDEFMGVPSGTFSTGIYFVKYEGYPVVNKLEFSGTGETVVKIDEKFLPDLAPVAKTGSYNDLIDTPQIPIPDKKYNSASLNAQSGFAVAEALANYVKSVPYTDNVSNHSYVYGYDITGNRIFKTDSAGGFIVTKNVENNTIKTGTPIEKDDCVNKAYVDNEKNKMLNYITYSINNNCVTITGCETTIVGSCIIPDIIEGYPVTAIGDYYSFRDCKGITDIIIPDSVTSIGYNAFTNCSGLTSITIPNGVTSIGENAFSECTHLISITLPNSITTMGNEAFYKCSALTNITLPNSITTIEARTFFDCSSLKTITVPNSITNIGEDAFAMCSNLTDIYYSGTPEQWNQINISTSNYGNTPLFNATIHYNQALATKEFVLENSGGGNGVQPDWNQNDPNVPDYVKNRTHYISKKYEDIVWDGNEEGHDVVDLDGVKYIKVSDQTPLPEDMIGGKVYYNINYVQDIGEPMFGGYDGLYYDIRLGVDYYAINIIFSPDVFSEIMGYPPGIFSKGVYFVKDVDYPDVEKIEFPEVVFKLDEKYLPDSIEQNFQNIEKQLYNKIDNDKISKPLLDLVKPHSIPVLENILPNTNNHTSFFKGTTNTKLSLYTPSVEDFTLYVGDNNLVPCSIYASSSTTRCFNIPNDYPKDEQLTITFDYYSRDIIVNNTEKDRVLYATINYTDNTSDYLTIVPIANAKNGTCSFTTTAGKTIKAIGVDKHLRWTSGKIVITNIHIKSNTYEKEYNCNAYNSIKANNDNYGKITFDITSYKNTYIADTTANGLEYIVDDGFNKIYKQIDDTNENLNSLYNGVSVDGIIKENELVRQGMGYPINTEDNVLKLGRTCDSNSPFALYVGLTNLAPSVYYGTGETQRCIELPLGEYQSGQLCLEFGCSISNIVTNNNESGRVLYLCIKYTDGTTAYTTIVDNITYNGSYATRIKTEENKTVSNIYIEKHARWIGGKIVISTIRVVDVPRLEVNAPDPNTWFIASCKTYPSDTTASLEYGQYMFNLDISNLSTDTIYIADNLPGASQYNIIVEPQDQMAGIKEELASMQLDLLKLFSSGITSELVKPGTKTTLEFNSAYVLVSANSDIILRDGATGQHMKDTGGSNLPAGKLCIVVLPKQTIGETSRRLCYYIATSGSLDGAAKHFYVNNDNTVFTTPPSSNLTVFKIHFPE